MRFDPRSLRGGHGRCRRRLPASRRSRSSPFIQSTTWLELHLLTGSIISAMEEVCLVSRLSEEKHSPLKKNYHQAPRFKLIKTEDKNNSRCFLILCCVLGNKSRHVRDVLPRSRSAAPQTRAHSSAHRPLERARSLATHVRLGGRGGSAGSLLADPPF